MKMSVNPLVMDEFLNGIKYPADKDDLMQTAVDNDAPNNFLEVLSKLPDRKYGSHVEVDKELNRLGWL